MKGSDVSHFWAAGTAIPYTVLLSTTSSKTQNVEAIVEDTMWKGWSCLLYWVTAWWIKSTECMVDFTDMRNKLCCVLLPRFWDCSISWSILTNMGNSSMITHIYLPSININNISEVSICKQHKIEKQKNSHTLKFVIEFNSKLSKLYHHNATYIDTIGNGLILLTPRPFGKSL